MRYLIAILIITLTVCSAQALPGLETKPAEEAPKTEEAPKDDMGRDTPRLLAKGFLDAIAEKNYEKARVYLNLSSYPKAQQKTKGVELAKQLHNLLDQGGWIKPKNMLSNQVDGDLDDKLGPDFENIGGIRTSKETVPLIAQHMHPKNEPPYWQIGPETVVQIPSLAKLVGTSFINDYLPQSLIQNQWEGAPIGHWLVLIAAIITSYITSWLVFGLLIAGICKLRKPGATEEQQTNRELLRAFIKPLQLFLTLGIAFVTIQAIGLSLITRQAFAQFSQVIFWTSVAWFIWNLVDVVTNALKRRLIYRGQYSFLSAMVFMRRAAKFTLLLIVIITILDSFGYEVTTWLAALGIGGIALALGAQKTVENFVGSLTLIADRPIAIGDFCRFGTTTGTVEDIGMRSTRIRTKSRTVVSIPNGDFASMQIENYTRRDSYFYNPIIGLRYETTPDQIREILKSLRDLFTNHEKVFKHKVNFMTLNASSLDIEVEINIRANSPDEADNIREELNLKIMDLVSKAGSSFAFPSQTIYMAQDVPLKTQK